jgi:phosphopantothenoylcysteine decarboxylase/phosphopantothenate--cysteine ligase
MKNVLVGITGGIAAYKIPLLCRKFIQNGDSVRILMTENAAKFVSTLTLETLTKSRVCIDDFNVDVDPKSIDHIDLALWADVFIIAPATGNTISKLAYGVADNLLTSTYLAYPISKPLFICPAMNTNMYQHPVIMENLEILKSRGSIIIDPVAGELACKDVGIGKMKEPDEIFQIVSEFITMPKILKGKKVLVTAGPTIEDIDPVRFISNKSSGKMGYKIAEKAKEFGADVLLVSGPVGIKCDIDTIYVKTALEMLSILKEKVEEYDILIMAAAVADYRVAEYSEEKIKKGEEELTFKLIKNPDILKELSNLKKNHQIFVGFAAESNNLENYALEKLKSKNLDIIVANDISRGDIGFDSDYNEVIIYDKKGGVEKIAKDKKGNIAERLLYKISEYINGRNL